MAKLDISFGHFWVNVMENVLEEISSFCELMVQHLGSDVSIFNVN
jgi:hypothetical protein